ncbi:MAG: TauD/TfdA family dioxygenase [Chromatiales bacterium]|nr:TauD/TfdA family dioxygenase [Chromatiales bacterium]
MDPSMRIEFQALEGECTVYDNHRVMHARRGFEQRGTSGVRHFRQCHVDREELHSRWRLLGARLGRRVHEEWITPDVSV